MPPISRGFGGRRRTDVDPSRLPPGQYLMPDFPVFSAGLGIRGTARGFEVAPNTVLQGLVAGKINKVIAHDISISPRTVEVYRANLMAKTGARSMSELMRIALAAGL